MRANALRDQTSQLGHVGVARRCDLAAIERSRQDESGHDRLFSLEWPRLLRGPQSKIASSLEPVSQGFATEVQVGGEVAT